MYQSREKTNLSIGHEIRRNKKIQTKTIAKSLVLYGMLKPGVIWNVSGSKAVITAF
jgi:hypothetical protein